MLATASNCMKLLTAMLAVVAGLTVAAAKDGRIGRKFPARFLSLERAFPVNHEVELEELIARDRARHARILQSFAGGIVDFPVIGSFDEFVFGLYFAKVKLGSPPREYNVQIDTGSDILWVTCSSCNNCPRTSGFGVELNFYDTSSSSTASLVSCSDSMCASAECTSETNQCAYTFHYGDNSGTTGYYVSDLLYFDTVLGTKLIANSSAPIVFGAHYNVYLQSITVNGQLLPIDPAVFATSGDRGTIVDSGTTLAYLAEEAYESFVTAISAAVSPSARLIIFREKQCYLVSSSVVDTFPPVSLNFAGGASMGLRPADYLLHRGFVEGAAIWCIRIQKHDPGVTILGDLVLKDRIIVYDLARQRIGWADYDCSSPVNVSITSFKDEYFNAGQLSVSSSSSILHFNLQHARTIALLFLLFALKLIGFPFL